VYLRGGENPLNLTIWVGAVATLPWLVVLLNRKEQVRRLTGWNLAVLAFIGVAASVGINYLQALALKNTTAVNFAFLYRTIVVFTVFFAWLFLKEKLSWIKFWLVVAILLGSYLLTTGGQGLRLSVGDLYTLGMAASAALIAGVLVKHTISKVDPDVTGAITTLVATVSLGLVGLAYGVLAWPRSFGLVAVAGVVYFVQILARNRAYRIATASFVTMAVSLTPLFVAGLSLVFLHETLDTIELAGGLLIVAAALLADKFVRQN
jgi:bacterial/archaeal transporter family protein